MKTPTALNEYRESVDTLDRAIVGLTARINATTYELLVLVRQFDERGGWLRHNFPNCAEWVADETNEAALLEFARTTTVHNVEERCRQLRNVQPASVDDANRAHRKRSLTMRRNADAGILTITVEVPIEDGELIDQALTKAMEKHAPNTPELAAESFRAKQADALVSIARDSLMDNNSSGRSSSADAYQVVVHVDHTALTKGEGRSDLPVETVKRLTCDGSIVTMIENADGEPLNVGRKQRTVPTAIRRAVQSRDRCCTFPGCNNTRFLETHHVVHWAEGGSTSVDNVLLLCSRHHRLHHEVRYLIRKDKKGRWYFCRPDGRAIPECGYQLNDMIDDDIGSACARQHARATAEHWATQ